MDDCKDEGVFEETFDGWNLFYTDLIAKDLGIKHYRVVRRFHTLLKDLDKIKDVDVFLDYSTIEKVYHGQKYTVYVMNKNLAFMLIGKFNVEKAIRWQLSIIEQFNKMSNQLWADAPEDVNKLFDF